MNKLGLLRTAVNSFYKSRSAEELNGFFLQATQQIQQMNPQDLSQYELFFLAMDTHLGNVVKTHAESIEGVNLLSLYDQLNTVSESERSDFEFINSKSHYFPRTSVQLNSIVNQQAFFNRLEPGDQIRYFE